MMRVTPMEVKDVKSLASQYQVNNVYLVPFEHESRKKDDNTPAIWYRIIVDLQVSTQQQSIVLSTSRKTLRQFANVTKALEFVDSELQEGEFERISILRDVNNNYNDAINCVEL
ncbi:hypothetical protein [Vibrio vulnificus]|uniref:hypothetical protein n=1 Tax=Vibrio vulnificus TaxID=672 RepID=UPI0010232B54|nr:hypothetical protein [Vibrio vulnificus]RZQ33238.1 hypothetical protein D8T38_18520 [Vibrio vulnificus]